MVFFGGKFGSECFGLFLFLFLFSVGRESRQHTGFWLAIKGKGPLQVVVSFLSLYYVLFEYLSGLKTLLYNSFIFFRSLIEDFFSFVFFRSLTGNFFFLLFSSDLRSGTFFFFVFEARWPLNSEWLFFLGRSHYSFFRGQGWKLSSWVKVYGNLRS